MREYTHCFEKKKSSSASPSSTHILLNCFSKNSDRRSASMHEPRTQEARGVEPCWRATGSTTLMNVKSESTASSQVVCDGHPYLSDNGPRSTCRRKQSRKL